jgi:hypothetical protein
MARSAAEKGGRLSHPWQFHCDDVQKTTRVDETERVTLSGNEQKVLGVLAEKDRVDAPDCARLAGLGQGMADAALRSLTSKGLAVANQVRKGLSKKADGTYSISPEGRAELGA